MPGADRLRHDVGVTLRGGARRTYSLEGFGGLEPGRYRVCVEAWEEPNGQVKTVTGEFSLE